MKNLFLFSLLLFTLNCTPNEISNTHGHRLIEKKFDKIIINKANKNDVRKILGPPSSISKFDNVWFYISRKKSTQKIFKLGKKEISENNVLIIEFDTKGIVLSKEILDINDMNEIEIYDKKTLKKYEQNNMIYNVLTTLREKINATSKNKRK